MKHLDNNVVYQSISGVVSLAAGLYLLLSPWRMTNLQAGLLACTLLIVGVVLIGLPKLSWIGTLAALALALYFLLRATGRFDGNLVRFSIGSFALVLGLIHLAAISRSVRSSS